MKLFTALKVHLIKRNEGLQVLTRTTWSKSAVMLLLLLCLCSYVFAQIQVSAIIAPPSCYNGNDASIRLQATGGNSSAPSSRFYTFSINNGPFQANALFSNLSPGNYSVVARDSFNVLSGVSTFLIPNQQQQILSAPSNLVLAEGKTIQANATAYVPNFVVNNNTYKHDLTIWSADANTSTSDNMCTDVFNCANLGVVSSDSIRIAAVDSVKSIAVEIYWNCGIGNFNILLNGIVIGSTGSITASNCNCVVPSSNYPSRVTISSTALRTAWRRDRGNILSIQDVSVSACKVAMKASITYARRPLYRWTPATGVSNPSALNPSLNPNTSRSYKLNYTNVNGCSDSAQIFVQVIPKPRFQLIATPESAANARDGKLEVKMIAGQGPFLFRLNGTTATDSTFRNLVPGYYNVHVIDPMNSRSDTQRILVPAAQSVGVRFVKGDVRCIDANNGWARVQVTGGYPPYRVSWSNNRKKFQIDTLFSGVYRVTVTDSLGFSISDSILIRNHDTIPPFISQQVRSIRVENTSSTCDTYVNLPQPFVADNCKISSIRNDYTGTDNASARYPNGLTWVNWIVRDNSGNESRFTQYIEVVDKTAPVPVPKSLVQINLVGSQAQISVADIDSASYDNCGIAKMDVYPKTFSCFGLGQELVTFVVEDLAGNRDSVIVPVRIAGSGSALTVTAPSNVPGMPNGRFYLGYGAPFIQLNASISAPGTYSYNWLPQVAINNPTVANPQVSPNGSLTYSVTVTNSAGCQSVAYVPVCVVDVATRDCHGNPTGKVNVCHNGCVISVLSSQVAAHLAHGDQLGRCGTIVCKPGGNGDDNNGGGGERMSLTGSDLELFFYPNPFKKTGQITFHSTSEAPISIEIRDALGRVLQEVDGVVPSEGLDLNLDVAAGIYFIHATQAETTRMIKVVKSE
jgi:hypothetical protein